MKEYKREYPMFSLCGLNCGLCPRHWADGSSQCPGCGGPDFPLKHPSCAVISCTMRHDKVEHCFQCSQYPCERYATAGDADSFITYRHVLRDFERARSDGLNAVRANLDQKMQILGELLNDFNDGRRKNFYCLAVNLLELDDLLGVMQDVRQRVSTARDEPKDIIQYVVAALKEKAGSRGIELTLRK